MSEQVKTFMNKNSVTILGWIFMLGIFWQQNKQQEKQLEEIDAKLEAFGEFKTSVKVLQVQISEVQDLRERVRKLESK